MRIAIVGVGSIGRRHLRNLLSLGHHDLVLVRSGTSSVNGPIDGAEDLPVAPSLEAALSDGDVDGVVIANPTSLHAATALTAARAGCAVFVEKPLTAALDDTTEELAAEVDRSRLLVGYQFRFDQRLCQLRDLIQGGRLGEVVHAAVSWGEHLSDWHPAEDYRHSYSARADLGGGALLTLSHPIDYLCWLLGSHPRTVMSEISHTGALGISVDDSADLLLRFEQSTASIHVDYFRRPRVHRLEITATEGMAVWNGWTSEMILSRKSNHEVVAPQSFDRNELFLSEMEHFIRVMRREEWPRCDLSDGLRSMDVIAAAVASSTLGSRVPVTERPCR